MQPKHGGYDGKGENWTREELIAELRYLASAVRYGWDEDVEDSLLRVEGSFDLLPQESEGEEE